MNIDIVRTRDDFLALESDWRRLFHKNQESNFYLSYDWFYAVLFLAKPTTAVPHMFVCRDNGVLVAIVPTSVNIHPWLSKTIPAPFYVRHLELLGNVYSAFRGGLVNAEHRQHVASELANWLFNEHSETWDMITFHDVSLNDEFSHMLWQELTLRARKSLVCAEFVNVVSNLKPYASTEALYRSMKKSHREDIQRRINRLNRDGTFQVVLVRSADCELDRALRDYYDIYARSWKGSEGDVNFHQKIAHYLGNGAQFLLFLLYFRPGVDSNSQVTACVSYRSSAVVDGNLPDQYTAVAGNIYIKLGDHAFWLKTAYREDFSPYSPGTVLIWFSMKHLYEREAIRMIDHQKGDEDYKIKWLGEIRETRYSCVVANPRSAMANLEVTLRCMKNRLISRLRTLRPVPY